MRSRTVATLLLLALLTGLAVVSPIRPSSAAVTPSIPTHSGVVSPNPTDNTPHVLNGTTEAVVEVGSRVIVGGTFSQVKKWSTATVYARSYIFAYDKATGNIDTTFNPILNGRVTSLVAAADGNIFVAGKFSTVGGVSAPYLVKMNPTTGALITAFNPRPAGMVYDIRLVDNVLYLGGTFVKMRNTPRSNFAAVDPNSGALLGNSMPFTTGATGFTRVMRIAVSPNGTSMVVIGNFTSVGGQTRENIARLDVAAGGNVTLSSWSTNRYRYGLCASSYDTYVRDVAFSPDGSYFVVGTTGAWFGTDTLCDALSRWENTATPSARPTWTDFTGGDTITAVAVTGSVVYSAGHMRWANNAIPPNGDQIGDGGIGRQGISAHDPESGVPLAWNPSRERGIAVWRLVPTADGMYVLSDSSAFGGEWHPRLTFVPLAGGYVPVTIPSVNLPANLTYAGNTTNPGSQPNDLFKRPFDGTTISPQSSAGGAPTTWSSVRGVVIASDRTFRFMSNGSFMQSGDGVNWATVPSWITFNGITAAAYGSGVNGSGRLFYTIDNQRELYARGFTGDYPLVSTLRHTVSGNGDGMDWRGTVGMTIVGDRLYHARSDGTLRRTDLALGVPVAATTVAISGPSIDGIDWRNTRALHTTAIPVPPAPTTTTTTTTAPTTTTTTPPPVTELFNDNFDAGLANWTNATNLTVDNTIGSPTGTPPSIRASVAGARAAAQRSFTPSNNVCASFQFKLDSQGAAVNLMRLRTSTTSVARLYVTTSQALYLRSDVGVTQISAARKLTLGAWTHLEFCTSVGNPGGTIQLKVNGVATTAPWIANTGSTPLSVLEIGDANTNTFAASFDDVRVYSTAS